VRQRRIANLAEAPGWEHPTRTAFGMLITRRAGDDKIWISSADA
jgi:hypothetical protein